MSQDSQSQHQLTKDTNIALTRVFDISHSVRTLRKRYIETKGTFDNNLVVQSGKTQTKKLNNAIGQYKKHVKKGKDEFTKETINQLF